MSRHWHSGLHIPHPGKGILFWDSIRRHLHHSEDGLHPAQSPENSATIVEMLKLPDFSAAIALGEDWNDTHIIVDHATKRDKKGDDEFITYPLPLSNVKDTASITSGLSSISESPFHHSIKAVTDNAEFWKLAMLDTGSTYNLITPDCADAIGAPTQECKSITAYGLSDGLKRSEISASRQITLSFHFINGSRMHCQTFYVLNTFQDFDVILGGPFLHSINAHKKIKEALPIRKLSTEEKIIAKLKEEEEREARDAALKARQEKAHEEREKKRSQRGS